MARDLNDWLKVTPTLVHSAEILVDNKPVQQSAYCSVIPSFCSSPSELQGWMTDPDESLGYHYIDHYEPLPMVNAALVQDGDIWLGIDWSYNGNVYEDGSSQGYYIMDAYAYAEINASSSLVTYSATAYWKGGVADNWSPRLKKEDPTASLQCEIHLEIKRRMHDQQIVKFCYAIFGDGSGEKLYGPV